MIDEYDQLMDRISLFARFSPEEIVNRTWTIGTQPTYNLVHINKGKVSVTCAKGGDHVVGPLLANAAGCALTRA